MTRISSINHSSLPPLHRIGKIAINSFLFGMIPLMILAILWKYHDPLKKRFFSPKVPAPAPHPGPPAPPPSGPSASPPPPGPPASPPRSSSSSSSVLPLPSPSSSSRSSSSPSSSSSSSSAAEVLHTIFPKKFFPSPAENPYIAANQRIRDAVANKGKGSFILGTVSKEELTKILRSDQLVNKLLPESSDDNLESFFQWSHFIENLESLPNYEFNPKQIGEALRRTKDLAKSNKKANALEILKREFPDLNESFLEIMLVPSEDLDLTGLNLENAREYLLFMQAIGKDSVMPLIQRQIESVTDISWVEPMQKFVAELPRDLQTQMLEFLSAKLTEVSIETNPFKAFYKFKNKKSFSRIKLIMALGKLNNQLKHIDISDFQTYLFCYQLKKEFGNTKWIKEKLNELLSRGGITAGGISLPNSHKIVQDLLDNLTAFLDNPSIVLELDMDTSRDVVVTTDAQEEEDFRSAREIREQEEEDASLRTVMLILASEVR